MSIITTTQNTGAQWDAQAEFDIGVLLKQYLATHSPPADAKFAADFNHWASRLCERGRARLLALGKRPIRSAETPTRLASLTLARDPDGR